MSIMKWFNKPKWQNTNEKVRLASVSHDQDPELLRNLTSIVNNDESLLVKKAALNRISDQKELLKIAQNSPEKTISQSAYRKLIEWFSTASQAKSEQLEIATLITDKNTREHLAQHAVLDNVRELMIQNISQQGLLGTLLLNEPNTQLQQQILKKITQQSTLKRIAEKTKKKNKSLYKNITVLLNNDSKNDHDTLALELCQTLEKLVHQKGATQNIDLNKIKQQWKDIQSEVSANLVQRYVGAYRTAEVTLDPRQRDEFLKKQKHQRITAHLSEINQQLKKAESLELKKIQEMINTHTQLDLTTADSQQLIAHEKSLSELNNIRDEKTKEQQIPTSITHVYDQLTKEIQKEIVQPDRLSYFKKKWAKNHKMANPSVGLQQLKHQFDQLIIKLAEKIEHSAQLRNVAADDAIALIAEAEKEITDGHLNNAKSLINKIAQLKHKAGYSHPVIKKHKFQLDQVWNKLKELRQWQKWSNDKIRNDIINELNDLIGTGLHPDAVLKKLKESNQHWYHLEDMEKLEGDKFPTRNQKLWTQFREVSQNLFQPAQPFYEKRSELQNKKIEEYDAVIKDLNDCDLSATNERDLARKSREAISLLRSLDALPPKTRGNKAKALRAGIQRIDKKLEEFYSIAEKRKTKLIEQVIELKDEPNISQAIEQAKQLQSEWKSAGIVKQHTERKLWKKFRKANDAVFARRHAAIEEQKQEEKALLQEGKEIIETTIKAVDSTDEVTALQSIIDKSISQWKTLNIHHKGLNKQFSASIEQAETKVKNVDLNKQKAQFKQMQVCDEICTAFEQGSTESVDETIKALRAKTEGQDNTLVSSFEQRINQEAQENNENLTLMLIIMEYLTGLETPEQEAQQRMNYQVERLSNRMSGETQNEGGSEAVELITQWYLTPKQDASFMKTQQARINKNLKALQQLIIKS